MTWNDAFQPQASDTAGTKLAAVMPPTLTPVCLMPTAVARRRCANHASIAALVPGVRTLYPIPAATSSVHASHRNGAPGTNASVAVASAVPTTIERRTPKASTAPPAIGDPTTMPSRKADDTSAASKYPPPRSRRRKGRRAGRP